MADVIAQSLCDSRVQLEAEDDKVKPHAESGERLTEPWNEPGSIGIHI